VVDSRRSHRSTRPPPRVKTPQNVFLKILKNQGCQLRGSRWITPRAGMTTSSIIKTAFDAIVAKQSALSAGYQPVAQNGQRYEELLSLMCSDDDKKRHSPLVNAGYAVRLAVVTSTVNAFVQYHANQPVQLVNLGCGFDVLSLWAHSLDPSNVTVFEFDTSQISNPKKELMLQKKMVVDFGSDECLVLQGRIIDPCVDCTSDQANYRLFSCDLRNIETVERCLLTTLDKSKPTLVISEVVLTYLGRQAMDKLLQWCAENLCCSPGSCIAAFETLGPKAPAWNSVVEGYKEQYCRYFLEKLSRGLTKFDPEELFHPPGFDVPSVEMRFRNAGFSNSFAALAGRAMLNEPLRCSELFDEHAALNLHLRSYVLVVGFARNVEVGLVRGLCPWSSVVKHDFPAITVHGKGQQTYVIRTIQAKDQDKVRNLFSRTYEGLFEEYPSVRKMVKTGLKTDLSCSADDKDTGYSTIGARYGMTGGVFLVAVGDSDEALLGCIGLRLCQRYERRLSGDHDFTLEIHRLAVSSGSQGNGVGKTLIGTIHSFVMKEHEEADSYGLVAATPAVLIPANNLYVSCGFSIHQKELSGMMTINTYSKVIEMCN
jgi:GNAT superfamily N-acetyltransferase